MLPFRNSTLSSILFGLFSTLVFLVLLTYTRAFNLIAEFTTTTYIYLPYVAKQSSPPPTLPGWLIYVNYYREMAELPAVSENMSFSYGDLLHARYIVKNNIMQHTEDPSNPWYTPEGLAAAQASNLAGSHNVDASDKFAIDSWMQAPFHAVGVIDPGLLQVGYGSYREANGGLQMGAGLDVIRGQDNIPPSVEFPVKWPSDGTSVPLTEHWGEHPDPLTSCPGYTSPSGLPIILQIGPGNLTPDITSHSFMQGSTLLEHCVFDETSYTNPDNSQQSEARDILDARDAIILIPRDPLTPGASYTVSVTVNGQDYLWSFTVSLTAEITSEVNDWLVPWLDGIGVYK